MGAKTVWRLSDLKDFAKYDWNWRRILPRLIWKVIGGVLLMLGLLTFYAVMQAHTAVAMGALDTPPYSCIAPAHAKHPEALADRAFAHAVARHDMPDGAVSTDWHVRQAFAYVGSRLAFSAAERKAMILPMLEKLPTCKSEV